MTVIIVHPGPNAITNAITAASDGDTLVVTAGTYNEKLFVTKSLTFLGAQHGVDARTRPFIPAQESILRYPLTTIADPCSGIVNLGKTNIILDGFTLQTLGHTSPSSFLDDFTAAIFAGDTGSVALWQPRTSTLDIRGLQVINNIIQNNANGVAIASIEPGKRFAHQLPVPVQPISAQQRECRYSERQRNPNQQFKRYIHEQGASRR